MRDNMAPSYTFLPVGDGDCSHLEEAVALPTAFTLVEGQYNIGSAVIANLPTVDTAHATVEVTAGGDIFLTDGGSTNGTSINGRGVEPGVRLQLVEGDEVVFGDESLAAFELAAGSTAAFAPPLPTTPTAPRESPVERMRREAAALAQEVKRRAAATKTPAPNPTAASPTPPSANGGGAGGGGGPVCLVAAEPAAGVPLVVTVGEGEELLVGQREGAVDVYLPVSGVASVHAQLGARGGTLYVTDFSKGATAIDGAPLAPGSEEAVAVGARLSFAGATFTVTAAVGKGGAPPVAAPAAAAVAAVPVAVVAPEVLLPAAPAPSADQLRAASEATAAADAELRALEEELGVDVDTWRQMLASTARQAAIVSTSGAATDTQLVDLRDEAREGMVQGSGMPWLGVAAQNAEVMSESAQVAEGGGRKGFFGGLSNFVNSSIQVNNQYNTTLNYQAGSTSGGLGDAKATLLKGVLNTDRGLGVGEEQRRTIEERARAVEAGNPTKAPLRSPLMNGRWALQYTTNQSAVGAGLLPGLRPKGPVYQTFDVFSMKLVNEYTYSPLPFVKFVNIAVADLEGQSESRVAVKWRQFKVGPFKLAAPPSTPSRAALEWETAAMEGGSSGAWLDTTFLDYDLRIARGHRGDLYILTRED